MTTTTATHRAHHRGLNEAPKFPRLQPRRTAQLRAAALSTCPSPPTPDHSRPPSSAALEHIFDELNCEPTATWATGWRRAGHRSLSVGDVVVIGETAWGRRPRWAGTPCPPTNSLQPSTGPDHPIGPRPGAGPIHHPQLIHHPSRKGHHHGPMLQPRHRRPHGPTLAALNPATYGADPNCPPTPAPTAPHGRRGNTAHPRRRCPPGLGRRLRGTRRRPGCAVLARRTPAFRAVQAGLIDPDEPVTPNAEAPTALPAHRYICNADKRQYLDKDHFWSRRLRIPALPCPGSPPKAASPHGRHTTWARDASTSQPSTQARMDRKCPPCSGSGPTTSPPGSAAAAGPAGLWCLPVRPCRPARPEARMPACGGRGPSPSPLTVQLGRPVLTDGPRHAHTAPNSAGRVTFSAQRPARRGAARPRAAENPVPLVTASSRLRATRRSLQPQR